MAKRVSLVSDEFKDKERKKAVKKDGMSDEQKRPNDQKSASYRIGQDAINRLNAAAQKYNVLKGDMARFLILNALDMLDAGEISIEYQEDNRPKRIDI